MIFESSTTLRGILPAIIVSLSLTRAAKANPHTDQAIIFVRSADAKQNNGDPDGAIEDYTKAIQSDPKSVRAFGGRADARKKKGHLRAALADYNRALALDPKNPSAREGLADLKANRLYRTKPVVDGGFAAKLNAPSRDDFQNPRYLNFTKGDPKDPKSSFARPFEFAPRSPTYFADIARAKRDDNDFAGAIAAYDEAIKLLSNAVLYTRRAYVKSVMGDLDGAKLDYDHAIEIDPAFAPAYSGRGDNKLRGNDPAGAHADFDRAVELAPKSADAYFLRADAEYIERDWPRALADYRRACEVETAPQDYARLMIWLVRMRLGEGREAGDEIAAFIERRATAAGAGWVCRIGGYFSGKVTEAELLDAANSPEPDKDRWQHCEAWFYIGAKHLLDGAQADATEDFRRCLATGQRAFLEYRLAGAELQVLAR